MGVLIVPFMELKPDKTDGRLRSNGRLNRTFYGIETAVNVWSVGAFHVLIVPFMELKL